MKTASWVSKRRRGGSGSGVGIGGFGRLQVKMKKKNLNSETDGNGSKQEHYKYFTGFCAGAQVEPRPPKYSRRQHVLDY